MGLTWLIAWIFSIIFNSYLNILFFKQQSIFPKWTIRYAPYKWKVRKAANKWDDFIALNFFVIFEMLNFVDIILVHLTCPFKFNLSQNLYLYTFIPVSKLHFYVVRLRSHNRRGEPNYHQSLTRITSDDNAILIIFSTSLVCADNSTGAEWRAMEMLHTLPTMQKNCSRRCWLWEADATRIYGGGGETRSLLYLRPRAPQRKRKSWRRSAMTSLLLWISSYCLLSRRVWINLPARWHFLL